MNGREFDVKNITVNYVGWKMKMVLFKDNYERSLKVGQRLRIQLKPIRRTPGDCKNLYTKADLRTPNYEMRVKN